MDVVDDTGASLVGTGEVGELVCRAPVPRHDARLLARPRASTSRRTGRGCPGVWVHGDWASVDEDGFWFLHGRSDDTLNIAGKRIGPAELESAAVGHPAVREAAAIGVPHAVKGETAWIFCCLLPGRAGDAGRRRGARRRRARQGVRAGARVLRRRAAEDALGEDRAARGAGDRARHGSRRPLVAREPGSHSTRSRPPLPERVALVTGGGRGIGANIARALAADGWSVVVSARSRDEIEAVAAEIGGRAVELDVASWRVGRACVRRDRAVDLLVANAGTGTHAHTWEQPPEDWWRTFEVNVLGVHHCCVAAIPGCSSAAAGASSSPAAARRICPARAPPRTRRRRQRSAATPRR